MRLMHAAFLLNGPTARGMQEWGMSMRGVIGDLGEAATNDIPDLVDIYLHGYSPEREQKLVGTLFFPYSMPVTGPSHLLDWVLYATLIRTLPLYTW